MPIQNQILISHESPISMMAKSRQYNDFDYALVHLFDTHPGYLQFFKDSLKIYDRQVLLDNSLFELGKAFDPKRYMERIVELKPTMVLLPDVFQDSVETRRAFSRFHNENKETLDSLGIVKIGAVHGKTWQELLNCYRFMADNADMIAISFDFEYFQLTGEGYTHEERAASGRQRFVEQLISKGVWEKDKPHHLLGCSLPQEFAFYRTNLIPGIRSIDTSNPIIHGMHNVRYRGTFGLTSKIKTKLADMIESQPNDDQTGDILYNVGRFRDIVCG